jgi:NADH-quinone oxidoreductase subunit L
MSDVSSFLWLIPALPLTAAFVTALFGPRLLRQYSHWPCILATAGACVVAVMTFLSVYQGTDASPQEITTYYEWIKVGEPGAGRGVEVGFTLHADALSAMMVVMVTFVGTLIVIYAAGYMHGDEGYARFFAEMSLFVFMMTTLVLADNFVLLYLGWEGVGLCSYLLVGFWFAKPAAAAAARKAFLVTRIGDVGLLLGILLLWSRFGHHLDYQHVFERVQSEYAAGTLDRGLLTTACLLLLCGAVGKSAQFPLHVWLPDAMEGPTPVSALIHAATMVTAGVYLVARCTPLFMLAPDAQVVVATLGAITCILAAVIALTQNDLKRVLAYSTLSQLGYMFIALGSAVVVGNDKALVTFAVLAAMFHLLTHAFFKALLFLSAGSVMHAMGNVIDMRRFSGLRKVLPHTHWTFLCGALALAGFPLLSGFWSKDEILDAAWQAGQHADAYRMWYLFLWLVGLVTAGLTAFYTFRAYFLTFWGEVRIPPEAFEHHHGHEQRHGHGETPLLESPPVMTIPLMILAVFALGIGFALGPTHLFSHFVARTPGLPEAETEGMNWIMMLVSSLVALGGIGVAWLMYLRQPDRPARLADSARGLYQLSLNKFHIDELYDTFLLKPFPPQAVGRLHDVHAHIRFARTRWLGRSHRPGAAFGGLPCAPDAERTRPVLRPGDGVGIDGVFDCFSDENVKALSNQRSAVSNC